MLGLLSGCYSKKMMEFTYLELDTLKTTQAELLEKVDEVSRQLEEEREARISSQAEAAATISELRRSMEILSYRLEDYMQILASLDPSFVVHRPDSASWGGARPDMVGADSLTAAPPEQGGESSKVFKSAYMDLTIGNYDLAIQGFKNYLVRYPNAANKPDAHYYLGESYFSAGRFLEAVAEFQNVIKEFPKSRFVPPAYLKSGICYQELDESDMADETLRELISRYPRSEEAEQARVTLQNLGG